MNEIQASIFLGVLGSAAFCELVRWLLGKLGANEKIEKQFAEVKKDILELRQDLTREQLLTLMHDYPDRYEEIIKVAKKYFIDLEGDWYMTTLFTSWLDSAGITKPNWIDDIK